VLAVKKRAVSIRRLFFLRRMRTEQDRRNGTKV
jgi:hypothetical protein